MDDGEDLPDFASGAAGIDANVGSEQLFRDIQSYQSELEEDVGKRDRIRAVVREVEKCIKKSNYIIMDMHRDPSDRNLEIIGKKGKDVLESEMGAIVLGLGKLIEKSEYYKYNDSFRFTFQRLVTVACTIHFVLEKSLCSFDECTSMIKLPSMENRALSEASIFLDYDDYLMGLLEMTAEFSRFCRNCITFGGSRDTVLAVHKVMNQISTGMHYITFKNDHLRKRYDGLKYHVKIVEEVVYDLKMKNFDKTVVAAEDDEDAPNAAEAVSKAGEKAFKVKTEEDASKASEDDPKVVKDASKAGEEEDALKTEKEASKAAEDDPKVVKDVSKATEETPKTTEGSPKATEDAPKAAGDASKAAEETPKITEDASKATEETFKTTEGASKAAEETPKTTEDASEAKEETPKTTEDAPKAAENDPRAVKKVPKASRNMFDSDDDEFLVAPADNPELEYFGPK